MNNKVDMQEVNELKTNVLGSLNSLTSQMNNLKSSLENLNSDSDFKGQTAKNVKSYNESFHIETIDRVEKINNEFKDAFEKSVSAFESEVDSDASAIIDESAIKEYKNKVKEAYENIEMNKSRMNATIASVHDLTKAKTITQKSVKEKGDSFHKQVKETLSHFDDFQASHSLDASDLIDMISPVTIMSSKVKDMPANRARRANTHTVISSSYKLYSYNNSIIELNDQIKNYQNLIYTGKTGKKIIKTVKELVSHLITAAIAGDGNFSRGINILSNGKYRDLPFKKQKLINAILNTNLENIEGRRLLKAAKFLLDNNKKLDYSKKLKSALKITQNYSDLELKAIKKYPKAKVENGILKNSLKSALKANTSENFVDMISGKYGIKEFISKEKLDFINKNMLGKVLKSSRYANKALGPIGAVLAVSNNFATEKTVQRKWVGSAVDLAAIGGTAATSTAIGTAIGGPIGAAIGASAGVIIGLATEVKVFNGKSITDISKDKANKMVSSFRNSDGWKTTKNIAKGIAKNSIGGGLASSFGKSLGSLF